MPIVNFVHVNGSTQAVEVGEGISAMHAAVANGVTGIDGDCGGVGACATCHVHVSAAWMKRVGPPGDEELAMLELTEGMDDTSRLACQIILGGNLDGLVLNLPESQF